MKRLLSALLISTAVIACSDSGNPVPADEAAVPASQKATLLLVDSIYYGGDILTMAGDQPAYVEALAVHAGKIVFAGARQTAIVHQGENTKLVDLKGKTLMPGFIDAHGHVTQLAVALAIANLAAPPYGEADSFDGVKSALKHYIEEKQIPKGQWVLGMGYDTSILPGHPHKELLDEVSTDHPILIIHSSGHIGVVNSNALVLTGMSANSPNPEGGVIQKGEDGQPNGVLEESAMWPVMLSVPKASEAQELAQATYLFDVK